MYNIILVYALHPPHQHTSIITRTQNHTSPDILIPGLSSLQPPPLGALAYTAIQHGTDMTRVFSHQLTLPCVPRSELGISRRSGKEVSFWCRVRCDGRDDVLQRSQQEFLQR